MCFQIKNVSDLWFQVPFHPIFTYEKFFFDFKSKKSKLQKTKCDFETSTSNRLNDISATETNFNLFYFNFATVLKVLSDKGSPDRPSDRGWLFRNVPLGVWRVENRIFLPEFALSIIFLSIFATFLIILIPFLRSI